MQPLRCSSIGKIMGTAKSVPDDAPEEILAISRKTKRSDEEKAALEAYKDSILSETAKSYLNSLAKEGVYQYRKELDICMFAKGKECEETLIDMANRVFGMFLVKNTERRSDEFITGEPDLVLDDAIWDIKNAWSLDTFPPTPAEAHNDDYEWQLRGYMRLFDKPYARIVYGLVNTPEHLRRYEQADLHEVSHIPENMRITVCDYKRDSKLEEKMIQKVVAAQAYIQRQTELILGSHTF